MKKVEFTETILRDANQSLIATRLPYEKFAPMLAEMDKAGFYSVECWGGATFDVCLRFLNEDPWERLRKIRAAMPNTKLQMLLRGQNILGYKHYSDDIVRRFVRASVRNGIDIIRIFDALNDTDNLKVAIEETVKSGAMASGAISYTTSPVHTLDKYVELAKEMAAMGVSSICIKDMAGIMTPQSCYDLVSALKDAVDLPVVLHTHCTTGLAFMTYLKGIEASTGSLGHGLSLSVGYALSARMDKRDYWVVCMTGDGEMDEGSNWEALMTGAQYGLGNLVLIVDKNQFQIGGTTTEIKSLEPLDKRRESVGWDVINIENGNDMAQVLAALDKLPKPDSQTRRRPIAIISNTLKGIGMIPGVAGTAGSHIFMVPNEDMERAMFQSIEALRKEQA